MNAISDFALYYMTDPPRNTSTDDPFGELADFVADYEDEYSSPVDDSL